MGSYGKWGRIIYLSYMLEMKKLQPLDKDVFPELSRSSFWKQTLSLEFIFLHLQQTLEIYSINPNFYF